MRLIHRALSGKIGNPSLVAFIYLSTLFFACHTSQHPNSSKNLLPRETEIPGWVVEKNSVRYITTIAELPGEDSQRYGIYGFEELIAAKYRSINDPSVVTVEIFRLNSALNAFGLFSFERGFSGEESGLEWTSFLSLRGLFFIRGNYYIRVMIDNRHNKYKKDLLIISRIIYQKIFQREGLPGYVTLFDGKNYLHNLIYYKNVYPGFPLLEDIFLRKKVINKREYLVFFKRSDSPSRALWVFDRIINNKNQPFIATEYGRRKIAFHRKGEEKHIFISLYREWLFGVLNAEKMKEGDTIVKILYRELLEFIEGG
jgi:hypothetical protein